MEQDYFSLYLKNYLQSDFPDVLVKLTKEEQVSFIQERTRQAATTFEQERLAGKDILQAQEAAITQLTHGLLLSTYLFLEDLLETEFRQEFQRLANSGKCQTFLITVCPTLEQLVQKYHSETGENQRLCYNILIGQLENLIKAHGV